MDMLEQLSLAGMVPVIKVEDAADAVPLCKALSDGGLPVAEITFRTAAAAEAISLVKKNLPDVLLGAGTVLTVEQAKQAVEAGAAYVLSPGFNPKVVGYCVENGIPVMPGCSGPSDIEQAMEFGIKTVKIFPAEALGGVKFIKALTGPYGSMTYVPTGGINEANMCDYLAVSKIKAVGGSFMAPADAIKAKNWNCITETTRQVVNKMLGFELMHIGINNENAEEAEKGAKMLSALTGMPIKEGKGGFFTGTTFEVLKSVKRGKNGHIAVGTNDLLRAKWHLERRGFDFDDIIYNDAGKPNAVYIKDEICGFAIHLLQK